MQIHQVRIYQGGELGMKAWLATFNLQFVQLGNTIFAQHCWFIFNLQGHKFIAQHWQRMTCDPSQKAKQNSRRKPPTVDQTIYYKAKELQWFHQKNLAVSSICSMECTWPLTTDFKNVTLKTCWHQGFMEQKQQGMSWKTNTCIHAFMIVGETIYHLKWKEFTS